LQKSVIQLFKQHVGEHIYERSEDNLVVLLCN